jgi:branched-subunit amino acid aminotransferase/4-amino-4-deoxychorismate lyase
MSGPGLIETVRLRGGVAPLWPLHLRRLGDSCAALGMTMPDIQAPSGGADRVHRLEVGAAGGSVRVSERPVGATTPVRLVTASVRHRPYPWKTTERAAFDQARVEAAAAGADEALLLTDDGLVAECGIWSLLWWEDDRLCAPDLGLGVLHGVGRARLAEIVGRIVPRAVSRDALEGRSLLVVNAARGVVPVAALDDEPVPISPATERLGERFWP